jgi:hypothetical protein
LSDLRSSYSPFPEEEAAAYLVPRDAIRLRANDARILNLADRLWERAPAGASIGRRVPAPLAFAVDVTPARGARSAEPLGERWTVGTGEVELAMGADLHARVDLAGGRLAARVSAQWVEHHPSLVARLLLETPAAALLARRGYGVLHAGAVVGRRGAVVIRGAAGAGKSTLIAAAYHAGLGVLGDETVLAARNDPDDLLAAVRDLTLLPDATSLLGLEHVVTPADHNGEVKHRIDLFRGSTPALRRGRRVATVLLGPRNPGPARLEPLAPDEFLEDFREGAIPQERWSGTPPEIAAAWARRGAYRLTGAADLSGAVELLAAAATMPAAAARA